MSVQVYTSRISSRDPDRFDITRKRGGVCGTIFAPSWDILGPAITARREAQALIRAADRFGGDGSVAEGAANEADEIEARALATYSPAYVAEMRQSYRANRAAWDALLASSRVVLVCYCTDATRCHRMLLAERCLRPMGAEVHGEL